jgi:hypothetical protein
MIREAFEPGTVISQLGDSPTYSSAAVVGGGVSGGVVMMFAVLALFVFFYKRHRDRSDSQR